MSDAGTVEFDCSSQSAVDQEIEFAAQAGLDYWAFVTYPKGSPMGLALQRYLASGKRDRVRFAVILTPSSISQPAGNPSENLQLLVQHLALPNYQTVSGGRPLAFFLPEGGLLESAEKRTWMRDIVAKFRALAKAKGGVDPYLVLMDPDPNRAAAVAGSHGFDAVSAYAIHGDGKRAKFSVLADEMKRYWERARLAGAKLVPTLMTGWDRRPRVLNPVPWERNRPARKDEEQYFYLAPSPADLAALVSDAYRWLDENRDAAPANTMIIYAWNENDEGGWLVPTLGEGTERISAIGAALRAECRARQ